MGERLWSGTQALERLGHALPLGRIDLAVSLGGRRHDADQELYLLVGQDAKIEGVRDQGLLAVAEPTGQQLGHGNLDEHLRRCRRSDRRRDCRRRRYLWRRLERTSPSIAVANRRDEP